MDMISLLILKRAHESSITILSQLNTSRYENVEYILRCSQNHLQEVPDTWSMFGKYIFLIWPAVIQVANAGLFFPPKALLLEGVCMGENLILPPLPGHCLGSWRQGAAESQSCPPSPHFSYTDSPITLPLPPQALTSAIPLPHCSHGHLSTSDTLAPLSYPRVKNLNSVSRKPFKNEAPNMNL